MAEPVLTVSDLATWFHTRDGVVKAVDGADLEIGREEIVTVVGESGSGKSVTALSVMRLIQAPGRIERGRILFDGTDLLALEEAGMRTIRGTRISMIFQNPYASLHPSFRIGDQMTEALVRRGVERVDAVRRSTEMLERIGVDDPVRVMRGFAFEVSAGVCQRVMLAMALMSDPELLIADEPTTNLDAIAQVQILDLIRQMRDEIRMSVLLITHDFGVVSKMADRVVVMYAGRQVESGDAGAVLGEPRHPYTVGLIESVPRPGHAVDRLRQIAGEVPDVIRLPPGCSFRPRCPQALETCGEAPPVVPVGAEHFARCWLFAPRRAA